ncbi:MAG: DUF1893 domain-containing protein [Halanaerobiales bacterium]|nr:DUF1893 domain-containing protein [Halanaerobiales bacterium]
MKDIERAREILETERAALVIVNQDQLLFSSSERGIKPLYLAITQLGSSLRGASIADRVVGRAAALLCQHVGIKELYSGVISQSALEILARGEVAFSYGRSCPYIKNREQTDLCPIEKMAQDLDNAEILLGRIGEFLKKIAEKA